MQYTKTPDGKWLLTEYEFPEAILELSSIQFQISLNDIYEKVNFAETEE
jgi:Uma2 family endonuclease